MNSLSNILEIKPQVLIEQFINSYNEIKPINKTLAHTLIKNTIKYYSGDDNKREELRELQEIERQWYEALKKGKVDYSVYNHEYYFTDIISCFIVYSRQYVKSIIKNKVVDRDKILKDYLSVSSIIDLGCGVGYSTIALKQIFPKAKVYGSNLENTDQYNFCKHIFSKNNCILVSDLNKINTKIDLVFASEYFEHFQRPIEYLEFVLNTLKPKHLLIANSFNTISIGHFTEYLHNNEIIPQNEISRKFNKFLREKGYKKVKTNIFNNKPSLWSKE